MRRLLRAVLPVVAAFLLVPCAPGQDPWQWGRIPAPGWPAGRRFEHLCWTGSELLLWGGRVGTGGDAVMDGYRTDLSGTRWQKLPPVEVPPDFAWGHSAVWTGEEWILWAGRGVRYSPAANAWRPVADLPGAPQLGWSTVWTGTEMIVWGGSDGGSLLDHGARYNPVTGAWTRISDLNAPSARTFHTAVWTGREMIVWGGYELKWRGSYFSTDYRTDLGRYDPATDTWRTTVHPDGPQVIFASAVWTGREMVVWGGQSDQTAHVGTGAAYDPAKGTWRAMTTADEPAGRSGPAAAWTGQEVVYFGGTTALDNAYHNTGARYVPGMDHWAATTTNGAAGYGSPTTVVWAGDRLVVADEGLFAYGPSGVYAHDAIPDDWQVMAFGPDNPQGAASADPDGDGQDNTFEYLAGTSPLDAQSRLRLGVRSPVPGVVEIRFTPMLEGRRYTLAWSDTLDASSWTPLPAPPTAGGAGEGVWHDAVLAGRGRFYRIGVE